MATASGMPDLVAAREDAPLDLIGRTVYVLIVVYLVMNRAIPDLMVIPIGISIRPYEVVLILVTGAWMLWMLVYPLPFPRGIVGVTGLGMLIVIGSGPFINALNATPYMINAFQRGLFRLFLFAGLFLASYHLAYRLRYGRRLILWVIGVTVAQAALGIYEYLTQTPLIFMFDMAKSVGLVFDPNAVRSEALLNIIFTRPSGQIRATGTAPHPIVLSALIALGILLLVVWLVYADRRSRKWLGLAVAVLVVAMPVPNSRTGFVMIAAAAIPLIIVMIKELPRVIPLLLAATVLMGVGFALSPDTPRLLLDSLTRSDQDTNTQVRIERFSRVPELLAERPIVGAGYLTHDTVNVQLFDNAFNMAIIEFGLLGFTLTMWWLIACLIRSWAATGRAGPGESVLTIGGVVAVLALLAGAATFDAWTFDQFLPTALVVLGVAIGRSDVILRRADRADRIPEGGREIFVDLSTTPG
jgi:hypothetical protein